MEAYVINTDIAWNLRKSSFPDIITFVNLTATESVSVTGSNCTLKCAHCGGKYLNSMTPIEKFLTKQNINCPKSILLSGGCDPFGHVPIEQQKDNISKFEKNLKINCHSGVIDETHAKYIASFSDVVSFDFVCDDFIVSNIYGVKNITATDYIKSYITLSNIIYTVPHICIGLTGNHLDETSEINAIDILYNLALSNQTPVPRTIAFIIFIPTKGTVMEDSPIPSLDKVKNILSYCRIKFPNTNINLGCMRPFGKYRTLVDRIAVDCGVNLIVRPSTGLEEYVQQKGLKVVHFDQCCAIYGIE